ncbi:hypothetical protein E1180_06835 [Roseibium denhamense]|nr:hypothetical protein [Roseibium denhamense]
MRPYLTAVSSAVALFAASSAFAQSAPETLRINVDPPEPGIRAITVNKKFRAIISRDDKGVVIDTFGSDNSAPPCDVKLEVTLENSRILHRDANICSGSTLVVDVSNDGKPGAAARVVGTTSGVQAGPVTSSPAETPSASTNTPAQQPQSESPSIVAVDPPEGTGGLKPLDQVDTPISTPGANGTETASLPPSDFESMVQERLNQQDGGALTPNSQPALVVQSDAREWLAEPGSQPGSLSVLQHTVPQTDDRDFLAQCGTQSGFALITFQQAPAGLAEGMPQTVQITASDFSTTYTAFGSSPNNEAGISLPQVNVEMTDPIWDALIRQSELSIAVEGMPAYQVSLSGSANPVRLFSATCALPQQIVSDDAFGAPALEASSDMACSELGRVRSVEAVRPGQIVFRNASQQTVEVNWVDYRGGERAYARLEPGQILEQQTYVSHAWTIRDGNGQCRGIYVTRTPYREVVINGPAGSSPSNGVIGDPWGTPQNAPFGQQNQGFPAGPVPPGTVGGANPSFGAPQQTALSNVADYLCTAGIDLNVVFAPDGNSATVAEMGYGAVTLQRQGGANTFYFEGQGHVLKGQVQNATWSRPGLRDVFCARR